MVNSSCACALGGDAYAALDYWGTVHRSTVATPYHASVAGALFAKDAVVNAISSGYGFSCWAISQGRDLAAPVATPALAWCLDNRDWLPQAVAVFLIALVLWNLYYPSRLLFKVFSRIWSDVVFHFAAPNVPTTGKFVALTINSSPCYYNTNNLLLLLEEHDAKATFFIHGSNVQLCDRVGAGSGKLEHGRYLLREMVNEGHEIANSGWYPYPQQAKRVTTADMEKQLLATGQLLSEARHAALDRGEEDAISYRRRRWFRPEVSWGLDHDMIQMARKHGYMLALGSVWPWDTHIGLPLINALYIWSKVYSGAIITLHDRRKNTAATLAYVLPWLKWWGYSVTTLSEAHQLSGAGGSLTAEALALHNQMFAAEDGNMDDQEVLKQLLSYDARMVKERERAEAAAEEEERQRLKAQKFAEMDQRAGIDRRFVSMSAAEMRMEQKRERERKEAEKRRAIRAAERIRAKERYEAYLRESAIRAKKEQELMEELKIRQEQEKLRKEKAAEDHKRRVEAERAYLERMKAEREEREATGRFSDDSDSESESCSDWGSEIDIAELRKPKSLAGKMKLKMLRTLRLKKKLTEEELATLMAAALAAKAARAAAREVERQRNMYGWYGAEPTEEGKAALAAQEAVIAEQRKKAKEKAKREAKAKKSTASTAASSRHEDEEDEEPAPEFGDYARGPDGQILVGFDAKPLLLATTEEGQRLLLSSDGEVLLGPNEEQIVLVLGGDNEPMVDRTGRPVLVAIANEEQPEEEEEPVPEEEQRDVLLELARPVALGLHSPGHPVTPVATRINSVFGSAGQNTAANSAAPSVTGSMHSLEGDATATIEADAAEEEEELPPLRKQYAVHPDGSLVLGATGRPAEVVLGPNGAPVLGHDHRPLLVADDEEGRPLDEGLAGEPLMGPHGDVVHLAVTSKGDLVALTSEANLLTAADGTPLLVLTDHYGRPLLDEQGLLLLLDTSTPESPPLTPFGTPAPSTVAASEVLGDRLLPEEAVLQQAVAEEQLAMQERAAAMSLPPTVPSTPVPSLPPTPGGRSASAGGAFGGSTAGSAPPSRAGGATPRGGPSQGGTPRGGSPSGLPPKRPGNASHGPPSRENSMSRSLAQSGSLDPADMGGPGSSPTAAAAAAAGGSAAAFAAAAAAGLRRSSPRGSHGASPRGLSAIGASPLSQGSQRDTQRDSSSLQLLGLDGEAVPVSRTPSGGPMSFVQPGGSPTASVSGQKGFNAILEQQQKDAKQGKDQKSKGGFSLFRRSKGGSSGQLNVMASTPRSNA